MKRTKGTLFIVATPIGNLQDISSRALTILDESDLCLAEDTRRSKVLFDNYNIKTKLVSYHKFSEKKKTPKLIEDLLKGKKISIVSDAGTPLISDPGGELVTKAIESGIRIESIPGPSSIIAALTVSGFNLDSFSFYGFFPKKGRERKLMIDTILHEEKTSVCFETGERIERLFRQLKLEIPERRAVIVKELTKINESYFRGTISFLSSQFDSNKINKKGEFVVIFSGQEKIERDCLDLTPKEERILQNLLIALPKKDALKLASDIFTISKNKLYEYILSK
tara:strand:- start:32931 stop:33773 length:843 start_codon:yes stop_codon:yes gene_type:complete